MGTTKRKQFTFYASYFEAIQALSPEDQNAVFMAICAYALNGEQPQLTGVPAAILTLIMPTLDAGRKKAEARSQSDGGNRPTSDGEDRPACGECHQDADKNQGRPSGDEVAPDENADQIPLRPGKDTSKKAQRPDEDTARALKRSGEDTGKEKEVEGEVEVEVEGEAEKEKESFLLKAAGPPSRARGVTHEDTFAIFAGENAALLASLRDFAVYRETINKPLTERVKQRLLAELAQVAPNPAAQIQLLDKCVSRGYPWIFDPNKPPMTQEQRTRAAAEAEKSRCVSKDLAALERMTRNMAAIRRNRPDGPAENPHEDATENEG